MDFVHLEDKQRERATEKKVSIKPFQIVLCRRIHSKLLQWMLFNKKTLWLIFWLCMPVRVESVNRFGFLFQPKNKVTRIENKWTPKMKRFYAMNDGCYTRTRDNENPTETTRTETKTWKSRSESFFDILNSGLANYFITIFHSSTVHHPPFSTRLSGRPTMKDLVKKATRGNNIQFVQVDQGPRLQ